VLNLISVFTLVIEFNLNLDVQVEEVQSCSQWNDVPWWSRNSDECSSSHPLSKV